MLRETETVYDFNARFKRSRGLPTLTQESRCIDQYNGPEWRVEEYTKAKEAIEPGGPGLGRGFIQHFLPKNSVSNTNTLQATITTYYQDEWRKEGNRLMEQSRLALWQGQEANDPDNIAAARRIQPTEPVLSGNYRRHAGIT